MSPPVEAIHARLIELLPGVTVTGLDDVSADNGVALAEAGVALLPWAFTATTR